MEMFLLLSLSTLWGVILVNFALTLRLIRWVKASNEVRAAEQEPIEKRPPLAIGSPAPEFRARTLAGQAVRLDDYAGRSVIFLFISPACGHCRLEMPTFIKLAPLARKKRAIDQVFWLERKISSQERHTHIP